jgi:uncharacterized protein YcnI
MVLLVPRQVRRLTGLTVAALLALAPAAQAHIQVTPTVAAPNDPVKFTVLVPGEKTAQTTRVTLKIPAGLLPFSYEDPSGWKRTLVKASNGGVDQVVWTGRLAADGFVEFSFLAGTPEKPGTLIWKALQTYSDGSVVRWIGAPGSEQPAPVTRIVAGAPKQNAGGEGAAPAATPVATVAATPASSSGRDWVARILALLALVALVGVGLQLRSRRPRALS